MLKSYRGFFGHPEDYYTSLFWNDGFVHQPPLDWAVKDLEISDCELVESRLLLWLHCIHSLI